MRYLPLLALLSCLVLGLLLTGPAARSADNKPDQTEKNADTGDTEKPEKVKFDSVDQVELHGDYYPPAGGASKKAPCVLLLHKIHSDSSKDGWDKLAKDLQKEKYAVLSFDFRGHGDSTAVGPNFWNDTSNAALAVLTKFNREQCKTAYNPNKPKTSISIKDFNTSYYPALVNDIAAAKLFLDRKNDSGECNSSNLILVGAEDGATLGALWMTSELSLYRATFNPITGLPGKLDSTTPEGKEVSAAIWLSISPSLGALRPTVRGWLEFAGKEKKIPMAFVWGEKEPNASFSKSCFAALKPKDSSKAAKLTVDITVKDSNLAGNALLGDKVDIDYKGFKGTVRELLAAKYLKFVRDEQVAPTWEERDIEKTGFAWALPGSTRYIPAKMEKDKTFYPVPWDRFVR
jgi:alpha-beta hydrolase superfamily lysophospholipase